MTIDVVSIQEATAVIRIGFNVSVSIRLEDDSYKVYSNKFGLDKTREMILAEEINTENYLNWPFEVIDAP